MARYEGFDPEKIEMLKGLEKQINDDAENAVVGEDFIERLIQEQKRRANEIIEHEEKKEEEEEEDEEDEEEDEEDEEDEEYKDDIHPHIIAIANATTTDEVINRMGHILKDNVYLKTVNINELKGYLKIIKQHNDEMKNGVYDDERIFNMFKLIKLYANIETKDELVERLKNAALTPNYFKKIKHFSGGYDWVRLFNRYSIAYRATNDAIWTDEVAEIFQILLKEVISKEKGDEGAGTASTRKKRRKNTRKKRRKRKCKSKKCKKKKGRRKTAK